MIEKFNSLIQKEFLGGITLVDVFQIIIIIMVAIFIMRIIRLYIRRQMKAKLNKDQLELMLKIINYTIISIATIWILSIVGLNLSGLLVAGGIAGIVIGFASQSIVGNLISGIFLMIERPLKIGEAVNINGTIGIIENISILSTVLRDYDGLQIRMPNENVFTSKITNYVSNLVRRFNYIVGIRYEDDANDAIAIIREILQTEPFVLVNPAPLVFVDELDNSSVNIMVKIWAPVSEWYALKQKLLWQIKKTLEEKGIEIAFPQCVVWMENKNFNNKK